MENQEGRGESAVWQERGFRNRCCCQSGVGKVKLGLESWEVPFHTASMPTVRLEARPGREGMADDTVSIVPLQGMV